MGRVLIVGDAVAESVARAAGGDGDQLQFVASGTDAIARCALDVPDVLIVPVRLPDESSPAVMHALRMDDVAVVIVADHASDDGGLASWADRADMVLTRPVSAAMLSIAIVRATEAARLRRSMRVVAAETERSQVIALAGVSSTMVDLREQVLALAPGSQSVLLLGEVGSGKRMVARYLHAVGPRATQPLLELPCDSSGDANGIGFATETLLGRAGTSERARAPGYFEMADGGTIFLDDVGAISADAQRALLDVVERGAFRPLGSADECATTARVIASTHRDLVNEVTDDRFREDLYYRLSVTPVYLPPLRARSRDDLVALVEASMQELAASIAGAPAIVGEQAQDALVRHAWPGNVRELRAVLERAAMLARGEAAIGIAHLPPELATANPSAVHRPRLLADVERDQIALALRAHNDNRTHAAQELGISRATLIKKIKEYGWT